MMKPLPCSVRDTLPTASFIWVKVWHYARSAGCADPSAALGCVGCRLRAHRPCTLPPHASPVGGAGP
eukprot:8981534-Karenia_brevis.AAC.1